MEEGFTFSEGLLCCCFFLSFQHPCKVHREATIIPTSQMRLQEISDSAVVTKMEVEMKADSGCPLKTVAAPGYSRELRQSEGGSKSGRQCPERKRRVRTTDKTSLPTILPPLQSPPRQCPQKTLSSLLPEYKQPRPSPLGQICPHKAFFQVN